ncbi:MAG TPA: ribose-phosphate pyrophosphokinase [Candidatus Faecicola pullistercoris]|nr:ribose-phosphate pyrophosphokinase [Candidatus Faecicola pullistercoris]
MTPFSENIFQEEFYTSPMGIIALDGATELAAKIDKYLVAWANKKSDGVKRETFIIDSAYPRFTTGDGKAIINETVRGKDLYIIADVGNHGCTYNMYGKEHCMSPDEHFADLKRVISAAGGKPSRITVIMPILYGGRQHRRNSRESLDCAMMLQELESMGVRDIITFDAHDPRVQNSVPLMGFDNFFPTYQILKAMHKRFPDVQLDKDHLMVVSPDEGAMARNIYYASVLGLDLGMFYKRRDYANIVNGRNPIVAHEYIGSSVMGMDIFVADDIIATGDSVLKLARELKEKGANNIFFAATFALFTEGVDKFQKAYEDGLFTAVLSTNLTYRIPELKKCEWFVEADLSKYIAYIISACNSNQSVSSLLEPHSKINELLGRIKK